MCPYHCTFPFSVSTTSCTYSLPASKMSKKGSETRNCLDKRRLGSLYLGCRNHLCTIFSSYSFRAVVLDARLRVIGAPSCHILSSLGASQGHGAGQMQCTSTVWR